MEAIPSVFAKTSDILPLKFWHIKTKTPLWNKTSLNDLVQWIVPCEWDIHDPCRGDEKLKTIEAFDINLFKPQLSTRDEHWVGIDIEVLVQTEKIDF